MDWDSKKMMIRSEDDLAVAEQCRILNIHRSNHYYKPMPYSKEELRIFNEIDRIYTEFSYYGYRKIWKELLRRGFAVGRDRTLNYMHIIGIEAFYPKHKPNTSAPNKYHKKYPYLLKDVLICRPNQVWATDITYIRMAQGFCYLVAVLDWHSRKVLSYRISTVMDASFCIEALEEALAKYPKPEIFNTDQGSQFTSDEFTNVLIRNNIQISMDSKGRAIDNIIVERFWRSIKYENIYLTEYLSILALKHGIAKYIDTYNHKRLHEALDYKTPAEVYYGKEVTQLTNLKLFTKLAV